MFDGTFKKWVGYDVKIVLAIVFTMVNIFVICPFVDYYVSLGNLHTIPFFFGIS